MGQITYQEFFALATKTIVIVVIETEEDAELFTYSIYRHVPHVIMFGVSRKVY